MAGQPPPTLGSKGGAQCTKIAHSLFLKVTTKIKGSTTTASEKIFTAEVKLNTASVKDEEVYFTFLVLMTKKLNQALREQQEVISSVKDRTR